MKEKIPRKRIRTSDPSEGVVKITVVNVLKDPGEKMENRCEGKENFIREVETTKKNWKEMLEMKIWARGNEEWLKQA